MLLILSLCTGLLLLATLLPLSRSSHWLIRGLDFPRLQFSAFAIVLLSIHFLILDIGLASTQVLALVTILCLSWQLWWILPYTLLWRSEVKTCNDASPDNELCVLTYNVLTPNRNTDGLIELVKKHQPDVLVTLESDQWWENKLSVLESEMPYSVKCPLDNLYGMHVFSRLPLHDQEIAYLVEKNVPSIHVSIELGSGDKVRAHFLHPAPPSPTENTESAERDAELLIVAKSVADSDQAVIVTGDLNDVAWSATTRLFRKISGLLDPRIGRGVFSTFHAGYPFIRWPLDHLFHSSHFMLQDIQRLPPIGSDHFPLLTRLSFNAPNDIGHSGMKATTVDHEWAKAIAETKEVSKSDVPMPGENT